MPYEGVPFEGLLSLVRLGLGSQRVRSNHPPTSDRAPGPDADSIDDEDEVMLVLAEELGKFTDYIGGPEYILILLPALENMAMQEESVVREKVCAWVGRRWAAVPRVDPSNHGRAACSDTRRSSRCASSAA